MLEVTIMHDLRMIVVVAVRKGVEVELGCRAQLVKETQTRTDYQNA